MTGRWLAVGGRCGRNSGFFVIRVCSPARGAGVYRIPVASQEISQRERWKSAVLEIALESSTGRTVPNLYIGDKLPRIHGTLFADVRFTHNFPDRRWGADRDYCIVVSCVTSADADNPRNPTIFVLFLVS